MSLVTNKARLEEGAFSQFKKVELSDKETFDSFFKKFPPEISELTFTNIFAWQEAYNFKFSIVNDALLIGSFQNNKTSFFYPIGKASTIGLLKEMLITSKSPVELFRAPEHIKDILKKENDLKIAEDRDNFDYVYLASDLINLKGKKFDAKRNFIKRFKNGFKYIYRILTPDLIDSCLEFEHIWCTDKDCENIEGLRKERCAILNMLKNFSSLNIKGAALEVEGKIIAISLGERLNKDTFVIHVEKANNSYPGAYQLINQEFCQREAQDFKYVNREQDLGVLGIRKAKLSYQPVYLLKKFVVTLKP